MKKRAAFLVAILVLLQVNFMSCQHNIADASNTFSGNNFSQGSNEDGLTSQQEIAGCSFGLIYNDVNAQQLVYDGTPVEFSFYIINANVVADWGIVLYINGIQQPFFIDKNNESTEMYVSNYKEEERKDMKISFTPIYGKAGDEMSVIVATVMNPNYNISEVGSLSYGYFHSYAHANPVLLKMETDTLSSDECIKNIPPIYNDEVPSLVDLNNTYFEIGTINDQAIQVKDNHATVDFFMYSPEDRTYRVSLYFDHEIVPIDGEYYYADIAVKKGKVTTWSVDIEMTKYSDANHCYAVMIPIDNSYTVNAKLIKAPTKIITFDD